DRAQRHLAIDRREWPAHRSEARELAFGGKLLLAAGIQIAVQTRIAGDRRIDVETVDRRVLRDGAWARRAVAVGIERRRGQRARADVFASRQAEPARIFAVIRSG